MRKAINNDFSNATDIADYLVRKGLPFREAHEIIGKIVLYAIQHQKYLLDLSFDEYKAFSLLFEKDIYEVLSPEHVVAVRNSFGGTSPEQVKQQIELAEGKLSR
jgi:argininosuccinate lyase